MWFDTFMIRGISQYSLSELNLSVGNLCIYRSWLVYGQSGFDGDGREW